jgi:microcystin degradation protein MlrC
MKIFSGGISTETNCFAPFPTTYEDFERDGLWHGNASESVGFLGNLICSWKNRANNDGHEFIEGLVSFAQPAGPITSSSYARLKREFLESFEAEAPYDLSLLFLHGAMIAEGCEDCEGDLFRCLRESAGPDAVICAVLDPHCHLSEAMTNHADLLICAKEYPHTDYRARMEELYEWGTAMVRRNALPVPAVFDCQMIGFYPTTRSPMREFVDQLMEVEHSNEKIISASFIHGFELGDAADTGSKVLVYTDNDLSLAENTARLLGHSIYQLRKELLPSFPDIVETMAILREIDGRVVISDIGDNPGAGFAADNVGILHELMENGFEDIVAGCFWDPQAVSMCEAAGVGRQVSLCIGGKSGLASGKPLDLTVTVRAINEDHRQPVFDSGTVSFGTTAWVSAGGADIVICSRREQVFSQEAFTGLGIALKKAKIILLKSGQHFYASFGPLADEVLYVRAPDSIGLDLASIPHRVRKLDYFPRVDDPLGLDAE